jgi:hypothetical protein
MFLSLAVGAVVQGELKASQVLHSFTTIFLFISLGS